MRRAQPDMFVNCGDTIYADEPLEAEVKLDDGTIWKNIVTEAKSKRGGDAGRLPRLPTNTTCSTSTCAASTPRSRRSSIWDDHEVRDNWYPTRDIDSDERYTREEHGAHRRARAAGVPRVQPDAAIDADDPGADLSHRVARAGGGDLRARSAQLSRRRTARTGRPTLDEVVGAHGREPARLAQGAAGRQPRDVEGDRERSADRPRRAGRPTRLRSVRQRRPGPPLGRELEIADLLRFIKAQRIRNVVWITADVHYCAAHHYDPARARFTEFDPFWEFVAGPLHAGTFGPNTLDPDVRARS